jgi:hypothetical protein
MLKKGMFPESPDLLIVMLKEWKMEGSRGEGRCSSESTRTICERR